MGKGLQAALLHVVDIPEDCVMSAHIGVWHTIHLFCVCGCDGRNAYYMKLHVLCPSVLGCKEHAYSKQRQYVLAYKGHVLLLGLT
jgi:hypothetical protein